ncbi:LptA/OstA family protein [Mitsuokella sp. UBA4253]|uniref:LptA/OstA family protein n=1 Tax=Mitsuokella sp. UBA4253 TaxID=1946959 RepID=UPI00257BA563|nr:LptA/OstA family protein [Mitsuokella sp. UBA4253]
MLKSCDILAIALGLLIGLTAPAAAEGTQPVTKDIEVADVTEVHHVSSFMQGEQPAISARSVQYDEKTGRYICHGSVQIHLGDRLITADEAQITSDLSAIWTQGTARLIDGENIFCSEAIYARPFEGQAYFFGTRCKLKRPGLAIDSDSIEYRWQDKIGVFDGHVLYIDSDGEKAFVHLEYDFNKNKIA